MEQVHAVIMAGGRGERFWPLSTEDLPKPFIPLLGPTTLLQDTVGRLDPLVPPERTLVSIGPAHEAIARRQLPGLPPENFIVEPVGRDTAACLGLCALHLEKRDPEAVMLALPADHHVDDAAAWRRTLEKGIRSLEGAAGVVFGIVPSRPETGYGYIRAEKPAAGADAWPVLRFVEKPGAEAARRYVESGDYFWNSGMFLWKNRTLLALLEEHVPETHRELRRLAPLLGDPGRADEALRIFSGLRRVSIDFAVVEKTAGLRLVPAEFGWDDIGNWSSLSRALPADAQGNVAVGPHVALESSGCVVFSDAGTVAVYGASDLVVVQANGRVLVCPREKAADLKRLVTAAADGAV